MEHAPDGPAGPLAPLLVVHEARHVEFAAELCAALRAAGHHVERHALSALAEESDRKALPELDFALDALVARTGTPSAGCVAVGLARGGTLAFLLGCKRSLAAVADVDGPVLHAELSPERPIQPLELALNFEGAFLGLFTADGPVGAEERAWLAERLTAAARPHELAVLAPFARLAPGTSGAVRGEHATGYHAVPVPELVRRVLDFLSAALAVDESPPHA